MASTRSRSKKRLRFSESSMLYIYPEHLHCDKRELSFTASDRRSSTNHALLEALRLKRLLRSRMSKPSDLLKEHLELCGIAVEEIVGIESLVLELEGPTRAMERRQSHQQMILMEQKNQKLLGDADACRLAELSAVLADISSSQARSRATMAMVT